jgi:hypothetical protein
MWCADPTLPASAARATPPVPPIKAIAALMRMIEKRMVARILLDTASPSVKLLLLAGVGT